MGLSANVKGFAGKTYLNVIGVVFVFTDLKGASMIVPSGSSYN